MKKLLVVLAAVIAVGCGLEIGENLANCTSCHNAVEESDAGLVTQSQGLDDEELPDAGTDAGPDQGGKCGELCGHYW